MVTLEYRLDPDFVTGIDPSHPWAKVRLELMSVSALLEIVFETAGREAAAAIDEVPHVARPAVGFVLSAENIADSSNQFTFEDLVFVQGGRAWSPKLNGARRVSDVYVLVGGPGGSVWEAGEVGGAGARAALHSASGFIFGFIYLQRDLFRTPLVVSVPLSSSKVVLAPEDVSWPPHTVFWSMHQRRRFPRG